RSPRLDVVFFLWQCDKKNHGWCEGPPVTVLCQSPRSAGRAFTLRHSQFRTKEAYCFPLLAASPHSDYWPVINRISDKCPDGSKRHSRLLVADFRRESGLRRWGSG